MDNSMMSDIIIVLRLVSRCHCAIYNALAQVCSGVHSPEEMKALFVKPVAYVDATDVSRRHGIGTITIRFLLPDNSPHHYNKITRAEYFLGKHDQYGPTFIKTEFISAEKFLEKYGYAPEIVSWRGCGAKYFRGLLL